MKLEDVKVVKSKIVTTDNKDVAEFEALLKNGIPYITGKIPKEFTCVKIIKVNRPESDANIARAHFAAVAGKLVITCFNDKNLEVLYYYGTVN